MEWPAALTLGPTRSVVGVRVGKTPGRVTVTGLGVALIAWLRGLLTENAGNVEAIVGALQRPSLFEATMSTLFHRFAPDLWGRVSYRL